MDAEAPRLHSGRGRERLLYVEAQQNLSLASLVKKRESPPDSIVSAVAQNLHLPSVNAQHLPGGGQRRNGLLQRAQRCVEACQLRLPLAPAQGVNPPAQQPIRRMPREHGKRIDHPARVRCRGQLHLATPHPHGRIAPPCNVVKGRRLSRILVHRDLTVLLHGRLLVAGRTGKVPATFLAEVRLAAGLWPSGLRLLHQPKRHGSCGKLGGRLDGSHRWRRLHRPPAVVPPSFQVSQQGLEEGRLALQVLEIAGIVHSTGRESNPTRASARASVPGKL